MNASPGHSSASSKIPLFLLATGICGLLFLSGESLWIDEGESALKAIQPTLAAWWHQTQAEGSSNLQLPLYLIYLWVWERIFPASEWWLRAANLPWYLLGYAGLALGLRSRPRLQPWLWAAFVLNPFVYYYLNEARPYMILIAGGAFLTGCLAEILLPDGRSSADHGWPPGFTARSLCGSLLLIFTSIFGVLWVAAFWAVIFSVRGLAPLRALFFHHRAAFLTAGLLTVAMGGYYAWTLHLGASPSAVGRTTPQTLLFVGYEQVGLEGIGPGRSELRQDGITALRADAAALVAGIVLLVLALARGLLVARRYRGALSRLLGFALVPAAFVAAVGFVKQFRVVGRHVAVSNPVVVLLFALGLAALWESRRLLWRCVAIGCLVVWIGSIASIRYLPGDRKNDYRAAAADAQAALAKGGRVWWLADDETANYYHLAFSPWKETDHPLLCALTLNHVPSLAALPQPDLVIYGRADIYDSNHHFLNYLVAAGYRIERRLPGFTLWVKGS